tara:strand:+ start:214 stop:426 length:213 start_codon:yes stop_codon:yes gene_type:complete
MINDYMQMVNDELNQFEEDGKRHKNLKMIIDFNATDLSHNEKEIKITPKYKKKFKSQVYIKKNTNNNSLF